MRHSVRITGQLSCPPQAPPSAPQELRSIALSAEGRLQLSWNPPLVTGGRSDLTYSVVCEHCDGGSCIPCSGKIRFKPGPTDLQETTVVVTDLDFHLSYTFTVETHSGVSHFGNERPTASITTALDYTGELIRVWTFFFDLKSYSVPLGITFSLLQVPSAPLVYMLKIMIK